MKKNRMLAGLFAAVMLLAGAGGNVSAAEAEREAVTNAEFPGELAKIPEDYFTPSDSPGTLVELEYDTYEAMSYEEESQVLHKRAIVYLPYGYSDEVQYNVFYLMHGGWSDETTYLGTPEAPAEFKNVLDHGIADGKIQPMIVVCPTYNNESDRDSWDYSLAIQLTERYHNELVQDLIPAVEGRYSTFAEDTSLEGLRASRDHRAFCGFSMGSVATWRTFQYCLDEFRYFMPSSGSLTKEMLYEVAANSIVVTVSGGHLEGLGAANGNAPHGTGLECRLMGEVGKAVARQGMTRAEANEIVLKLVEKYEHIFSMEDGNKGQPFDVAYDMETIQPTPEWQQMYEEVKTELAEMGIRFED